MTDKLAGFKSKWSSKGYVGGIAVIALQALTVLAVSLTPEQYDSIIIIADLVLSAVFGGTSAYGRQVATQRIE